MSWLSKLAGRPDQDFYDQISFERHIRASVERLVIARGGQPGVGGAGIGKDFVDSNTSTYIKVLLEQLQSHISALEYAKILPGDRSEFKAQAFMEVCWDHKNIVQAIYAAADERFFQMLKEYYESGGKQHA